MSYIVLENVCKTYQMGEIPVKALDSVSFTLEQGDVAMVVGPSGGGKTTLLNLLGGMDTCDSGKILVDGEDIAKMSKKALAMYRRRSVGFVFQYYQLMENLTAIENIEIATKVVKEPLYGRDMLERVGLLERQHHFPAQLSGGEQQRVSIARALAKKPKLLLCDEPTGALDEKTSKLVLEFLQETAHFYDMTVVIITHNMDLIPLGDRVITMGEGKILSVEVQENPLLAKDLPW